MLGYVTSSYNISAVILQSDCASEHGSVIPLTHYNIAHPSHDRHVADVLVETQYFTGCLIHCKTIGAYIRDSVTSYILIRFLYSTATLIMHNLGDSTSIQIIRKYRWPRFGNRDFLFKVATAVCRLLVSTPNILP